MPDREYVVSACLCGIACRYDGKAKPCEELVARLKEGKFMPVCPESLSGLPRPRQPCEQRGGRLITPDGSDVTRAIHTGAEKALALALSSGARKAILKSKSPSCGVGRIYDGTFTKTLCPGNGIWARMLLEAGFELFTEDNLPPL